MEIMRSNGSTGELEAFARSRTMAYQPEAGKVCCRVLGKFSMVLPCCDMSITPHLVMDGYWESWVTRLLLSIVQKGWRCVNVGANVGYYSLLLSELVGKAGYVHCFEPNAFVFDFLKTNLILNGAADNCALWPLGCGSEAGEWAVEYDSTNLGGGTLTKNPDARQSRRADRVTVARLDDCLEGETVNLILMDSEGMEFDIMMGARNLMARSPQAIIIMELGKLWFSTWQALLTRFLEMTALGYVCRFITASGAVIPFGIPELEEWWASDSIFSMILWRKQ